MNPRCMPNRVGISVMAVLLGAGPATQPAAPSDAPALTPRQQNLLLQLSDAEANIQAINKALKSTGYSVGAAYDRIDSSLKGNELMDRKGGGPVRWDQFYGKTARDFIAPAPSGDTLYLGDKNPWNDPLKRPSQFNDRVKEVQALKALCKRLAEETKVTSDDFANALDRDKAREDNSKLEFRGQLQASLSSFATELGKLDDEIGRTATAWGVTPDKATPAPDVAESAPSAPTASTGKNQPPQPAGAAVGRTVDLLALVDVQKNTVAGKWTRADGKLQSDNNKRAIIEIPYVPPEEYDYTVVFTQAKGGNAVYLIGPAGGRQFEFFLGTGADRSYGIHGNPATWIDHPVLKQGQTYTCTVKVRKDIICAYLDGKLMSSSDLTTFTSDKDGELGHSDTLGLRSWECPTTFTSAQITEITGTGHPIK